MNTLGLRRRKSPVQTILILLIESDVIYLVFQVSDLYILLICGRTILKVLTILTDSVPGFVCNLHKYKNRISLYCSVSFALRKCSGD